MSRRRKPNSRRKHMSGPSKRIGGKPVPFVSEEHAGDVFLNNDQPPINLPKDVSECRAARHAICDELAAALNFEAATWVYTKGDSRTKLTDVSQAVAAASENQIERCKRSWLHAAQRVADEGFEFESAPVSELVNTDGMEPRAHISCDHAACRAYSRNSVYIIVKGDEALGGLKASGLMPEFGQVEACSYRRRRVLTSIIPDLYAEERFVAVTTNVPADLTLSTSDGGTEAHIECDHPHCIAAGTSSVMVRWESRLGDLFGR